MSARAGVTIRESLAAESRHATVSLTRGNGYAFQRRIDPGGSTVLTHGGAGTAPGWVRLVRSGDLFEAYRSADGTSWAKVAEDRIPMGATVYVGLAATSHNGTAAAAAGVDTFGILAVPSAGNRAPAVSILSPAAGAEFTLPATVTVSATASDPENRMLAVDFYADWTHLARVTSAPYATTWTPAAAGTYSLTAVAHDADGASTASNAVAVTVQPRPNTPPVVSLATNGTNFNAPASITLTATASDPDGTIARVEFFNGSTRLNTDTTAPYSFTWSSVPGGTYTLTAVAYDNQGASTTSTAVQVTVHMVSATNLTEVPRHVAFMASADHNTNVTKYVLKVYSSTANVKTATPLATSDLGKPAPSSTGEIVVDRQTFFNNLAAGNYLAVVTAVNSAGETPSASVTFSR
jgi:hypothetical protein